MDTRQKHRLDRERWEILERLERWLEMPMIVLSFVWLALVVVDLTYGLSPILVDASDAIWVSFILDFALRFSLAPQKLTFLKHNWLVVLSLTLPALRALRIVRIVALARVGTATRGLTLLRVVGSVNRGMAMLGATLGRRGFGYVFALTVVVVFLGAAGMYTFEHNLPGGRGLNTYGTAVWWTAMIITTMGSEYWPHTDAGRVLCFLLALYAFAVFGYVTAALASLFVNQDANSDQSPVASEESIKKLRAEIAGLRHELQEMGRFPRDQGGR